MTFQVGRFPVQGPFIDIDALEDRAGVYVVLTTPPASPDYTVLDVGESDTVRSRLANHDRSDCWKLHNKGYLAYAVMYDNSLLGSNRATFERQMRAELKPVCGER